jgi:hypothetical protein
MTGRFLTVRENTEEVLLPHAKEFTNEYYGITGGES